MVYSPIINDVLQISKMILDRIKNSYFINSVVYMLGDILSQAIGFLVLPIFTKYLSPDDYGVFNYTTTILSFLLVISVLSLNSFLLRHYFTIHSESEKKKLFGTTFIFLLVFNLLLLYIEFMTFPILIDSFNIIIPFHPFFELAIIINFLDVLAVVPLTYYRVTKKPWKFFFLTSTKTVLTIFLGLILIIKFNMGVLGRYYGILYISLLFSLIYFLIMARIAKASFDFSVLKQGLKFSLPILPAAFASIAMIYIDRIVLERYVSIGDIGIYSVGVTLGTSILFIVNGFYRAIEPEVYELFREPGFNQKIVRVKNNFLYVIVGLGSLLIIFSAEFVTIMVSQRFYECRAVIPFFVAASLFRGAEILVGTSLYAFNKTIYQPIVAGGACIVNFVANLILVPRYGITGAAISSMFSFWIFYLMSVYVTSKTCHIKWGGARDSILILAVSGISYSIMKIEAENIVFTVLIKILLIVCIALVSLRIYMHRRNVVIKVV